MWLLRAQRADWWRPRTGRNVSTPRPVGTMVGEDHRDLRRHLCHHTISVSGRGKVGLTGRTRDGRRRKRGVGWGRDGERGGGDWGVGLLSLTAGGRMCPAPRGKACFVCRLALQGLNRSLWLRKMGQKQPINAHIIGLRRVWWKFSFLSKENLTRNVKNWPLKTFFKWHFISAVQTKCE